MTHRPVTLLVLLSCCAGARAQVYQTDFSDSSGWTLEASFNVCWCVDAPPASMPGGAFRSAPSSLNFNNGVDYEGPSLTSEASATSDLIDVSSLTTATLSFWCNYETEADCVLDQRNASGASIGLSGSTSIAANDFRLETFDCPPNEAAVYFYGQNPAHFLFGDGTRCIAGPVYRLPVVFGGPSGTPTYLVDLTSPPESNAQITAGSTWRFQCWYRDPLGPLGSSFNLSGALVAFFCP